MRDHFVAEIMAGPTARDPWDSEATPVRLSKKAKRGSFVEVRVEDGIAHPIRVVAETKTALAGLVRIAIEHGLDPIFPPAIDAEIEALFEGADPDHPPGTEDPTLEELTGVAFVTIDNEDSRDLDQALHVAVDGVGHRIRYALADAAFYVRPGTALFDEALVRGASFYLPGWMVPMLPRRLSEGLVSLNPDVLRRALVFDMRVDADGRCTETHVVRARIRSRAKLTYDGVQEFLDAPESHAYASEDFGDSLRALAIVGQRLIGNARERDVIRHRRRTVEVGLRGARSYVLYSGLRNDVERYNEQLSLLCNTEGAQLVRGGQEEAHVQAIYRVHPSPPSDRVDSFERLIEKLATLHDRSGPRWHWDRAGGQSLAAFLEGLHVDGEGVRLARAIQRQAIIMNVRSTFSDVASEHHGVGASVYARFSSPMREVVGVFLHKELWELLHGQQDDAAADEQLRTQVIDAANRSKDLQRRLTALGNRLGLDQLFEADRRQKSETRPVRRGTVMGLTGAKVHVSLDDPAIDVKLYKQDLQKALSTKLRLGDGELTLLREDGLVVARVGDAIDLRVSHRDPKRDRWVLVPASV